MAVSRAASGVLRTRIAIDRLLAPAAYAAISKSADPCNPHRLSSVVCDLNVPVITQIREYGKSAGAPKKQESSSSSSSSSSESDKGKKSKVGKKGQTEFWRRKMRHHHMVIDVNKDGMVSWDDFEVIIKKFSEVGNLTQKEIDEFSGYLRLIWDEEWGASGDPYCVIGPEIFLTNMEHVVNVKKLSKKVGGALPYFFKAVDYDRSGEISVEEFKTFFSCMGLSEEAATEAFNAIDKNGDGQLSIKEFVKLGKDFFISEDDSRPSKSFWGPLST